MISLPPLHPHRHHRGFRKALIFSAFALAAISLGFLGSRILSGELSAKSVPAIFGPGSGVDICNIGLIGSCSDTSISVTGPESVLRTWFFDEAIPWWIRFFITFGGGVAVIMLMIGGIMILTAGEDAEKRGKGTKTIIWAIVGLLIAMFAFTIVSIISNLPLPGSTG